jgi:hypothetical protein
MTVQELLAVRYEARISEIDGQLSLIATSNRRTRGDWIHADELLDRRLAEMGKRDNR